MLTQREREESYRLLERLNSSELISLKDTITKRQIAVENREEAIKAVIEYSQSAVELLHRKKLRRDVLFQYLAECNVVVPATAEKQELILRILKHWGSEIPSDYDLQDIDSGTSVAEATSQTEQAPRRNSSLQTSHASTIVPALEYSADKAPPFNLNKNQALGEAFVRWFYEMLNAQNPAQGGGGDFGPHHFWENCTLKLMSRTPDISEETFEGNELVVQRLQALMTEELLLFNPNISTEGVQVFLNRHGLLIVLVCGTIHQYNKCLGIFQQMFGLVRSPLDENWKVKTSQLQLYSNQVTTVPKLKDSFAHEFLYLDGPASSMLQA